MQPPTVGRIAQLRNTTLKLWITYKHRNTCLQVHAQTDTLMHAQLYFILPCDKQKQVCGHKLITIL